jgi:hypothetical protein
MMKKWILKKAVSLASKNSDLNPTFGFLRCTHEDRDYLCGLCEKHGLNVNWEQDGDVTIFHFEKRR